MKEMEEGRDKKYDASNREERGHRIKGGDIMDEEAQKIFDSIDMLRKMEAVDSRQALVNVKRKIGLSKSRRWILILQRVAAIMLLPLLVFSFWQYAQIKNFNQSIVLNSITTPPTLRSVFTLPDGSKVWLNGNTTITYPTFFKGKERLVELNGEAYFEVSPNKKQPFVVNTGKMLVEAVGTEFNCNAFEDEKRQSTLLTEGKVNILIETATGKREKIASLSINEMAIYDEVSKKIDTQKVDPKKYTAWKDGQIIFKNDVLEDVINRLERWYNVEFIYNPTIKKSYAFTGSFEGEELTQILKYIELTTPIRFEMLKTEKDTKELYQKKKIKIRNK
jgi:ferric-dicitrate binding protein FerR (iron transport regulator)